MSPTALSGAIDRLQKRRMYLGAATVRTGEGSACDYRGCNILLFFQTFRLRLVDAERLLIEIVAGGSVSACAATHANIAELAAAAFPLQVVDIAQFVEHHRVLPDVG